MARVFIYVYFAEYNLNVSHPSLSVCLSLSLFILSLLKYRIGISDFDLLFRSEVKYKVSTF
jgi:hypothetical protein